MNKSRPYLKAVTLASSILLVLAFIGYRSSSMWPFSRAAQNHMLEPAELQSTPLEPSKSQPRSNTSPLFMSGSKSSQIGTVDDLKPVKEGLADIGQNNVGQPNTPSAAPPK